MERDVKDALLSMGFSINKGEGDTDILVIDEDNSLSYYNGLDWRTKQKQNVKKQLRKYNRKTMRLLRRSSYRRPKRSACDLPIEMAIDHF